MLSIDKGKEESEQKGIPQILRTVNELSRHNMSFHDTLFHDSLTNHKNLQYAENRATGKLQLNLDNRIKISGGNDMMIEITAVSIRNAVVTIDGIDISEENLQRMERIRDDGFEKQVVFVFDTHDPEAQHYLYRWLKRQKATQGCKTWGLALNAITGTHVTISQKYRSWE